MNLVQGPSRRESPTKVPDDICPKFGFNDESRSNCRVGDCPNIPEKFNECAAYCEVRRTGIVGVEEEAPPPQGSVVLPGTNLELTEGLETTIEFGLSAR